MNESWNQSLPRGWAVATIGDLVGPDGLFADGDWIESKDQDPNGDVRLIQLADIGDGTYENRSARFLTSQKAAQLRCTFLRMGDLLIARMPDPLGRACIFPGDAKQAVTAVDVCIVRSGEPGIDHRWLMWFINAPQFRAPVEELQSGTTRKRISRSNLATIPLPVPPLPEQRRIVAEIEQQLSRLEAGVAALEGARAKLKRYRAAVLAAACSGRLVPTEAERARAEGRGYEPASGLLDRVQQEWGAAAGAMANSGAPLHDRLPEGWCWTSIGAILSEPLRNGHSAKASSDGRGVRTLTLTAVTLGDFSDKNTKLTVADPAKVNDLWLEPGDILVQRSNTPELVGTTRLFPGPSKYAIFPDLLIRIRIAEPISRRYIELALRSEATHRFLRNRAQGISGSMPKIDQGTVSLTPIALPPLAEQERIVAEVERRLSVVEELERAVAHGLKRAERLRQAILRRAFEGKLVPQDPADEPASVLLERIRAERATIGDRKAGRRGGGKARRRGAVQSELPLPVGADRD